MRLVIFLFHNSHKYITRIFNFLCSHSLTRVEQQSWVPWYFTKVSDFNNTRVMNIYVHWLQIQRGMNGERTRDDFKVIEFLINFRIKKIQFQKWTSSSLWWTNRSWMTSLHLCKKLNFNQTRPEIWCSLSALFRNTYNDLNINQRESWLINVHLYEWNIWVNINVNLFTFLLKHNL